MKGFIRGTAIGVGLGYALGTGWLQRTVNELMRPGRANNAVTSTTSTQGAPHGFVG